MSRSSCKSNHHGSRLWIAASVCIATVLGTGARAWAQPTPAALEQINKAKQALKAKRQLDAAKALQAAMRADPQSIEALTDLTFLQATSSDPGVRNPRAALTNAGKLLDMYYQQFAQRRQRGIPANAPRQPATLLKVTVPQALTAAYAANGRFKSQTRTLARMAGGGANCRPAAMDTAQVAFEEASTMAQKQPTPENQRLAETTRKNLTAIKARKPMINILEN